MKGIETQLAIQCAPVILGIKISNLLIVDSSYKNAVKCIFHNTELYCRTLYVNKGQIVFLIYYPLPLQNYLRQDSVWRLMQQLGYSTENLQQIFIELTHRYAFFMKTKRKFPHELGLILGYPFQDVVGFINHRGKNYLYSGYWKVYCDLENALGTFAQYEKAKKLLLSWVIRGGSIRTILTFRKDRNRNRNYENYRKRVIDKR